MDQKTLDYMAERVDKAREIQAKIIGLAKFSRFGNPHRCADNLALPCHPYMSRILGTSGH